MIDSPDEYLCKRVASATDALKQAKPFVNQVVAVQIYKALILPYFDYCGLFSYGLSNHLGPVVGRVGNFIQRIKPCPADRIC